MRMAMGIFHGRFQAPLPGYEPEHCPVNLMNLTLPGGVPLKLGPLPEEVADSADVFFCCSSCGKVFWEGGHHKRIATQFSYLLDSPSHFHWTVIIWTSLEGSHVKISRLIKGDTIKVISVWTLSRHHWNEYWRAKTIVYIIATNIFVSYRIICLFVFAHVWLIA